VPVPAFGAPAIHGLGLDVAMLRFVLGFGGGSGWCYVEAYRCSATLNRRLQGGWLEVCMEVGEGSGAWQAFKVSNVAVLTEV